MQVFNATWIKHCIRAGYRVSNSLYILSGTVCLYGWYGWLVKLKSADALPIENETIDVVPYQVSSLRPYVPPPSVDSFSPLVVLNCRLLSTWFSLQTLLR